MQKAIEEARKKKGEWAKFQMLYELHPVVKYLMTQLEASVDKDVALVAKLSQIAPNTAFFLIQGIVANNLGQSILSDFFVIPMLMNGGMKGIPIPFEDFVKEYHLTGNLYTMEIPESELSQLQAILPQAIDFANELHMYQEQLRLQGDMTIKMAVYEEKLKNWKHSREHQIQLEFADVIETGFIKKRKQDKEYQMETILNNSSQYFKDLTSLNGYPFLKVVAVFYNN